MRFDCVTISRWAALPALLLAAIAEPTRVEVDQTEVVRTTPCLFEVRMNGANGNTAQKFGFTREQCEAAIVVQKRLQAEWEQSIDDELRPRAVADTRSASAPAAGHIAKRCTNMRGRIVQDCLRAFSEAARYTDEYMRDQAERPGIAALAQSNAAIEAEDTARKQAARESAAKKRVLQQQADAQAARAKLEEECTRKGLKLGAATLGMSAEAARECGWGQPNSVHRTINAAGAREQWVYENYRFLYFQNGKLEAIQDRGY